MSSTPVPAILSYVYCSCIEPCHEIEKIIEERINRKEYIKAISSAIAGSSKTESIEKRHPLGKKFSYPLVLENNLENISKTKELLNIIKKLGLSSDIERSHKPKLRKGLSRSSNKRRFRKSILIVAKNSLKLEKAGRNIPGVDVCAISSLTVNKLAPGGIPRLAIWSKGAVESVEAELNKNDNKNSD